MSHKFRRLKLESPDRMTGLADIILSKGCIVQAKLCDDSKTIHIKIENVYGFVYEAFTEDYNWFLETFSFL